MEETGSVLGREVLFREEQRFKQPWLWALVLIAAGLSWFTFLYELFQSPSPDGKEGQMWVALPVWLLVGLGVPALVFACRLVVEVRSGGLYYRYHPFHRRMHRIGWDEIKEAEARTYSPIREFGGWGIRCAWRRGGGKAYNVYGVRGLQLELYGGRRILFGSQEADELAYAVRGFIGARATNRPASVHRGSHPHDNLE